MRYVNNAETGSKALKGSEMISKNTQIKQAEGRVSSRPSLGKKE
jgi:hypothetical protein